MKKSFNKCNVIWQRLVLLLLIVKVTYLIFGIYTNWPTFCAKSVT